MRKPLSIYFYISLENIIIREDCDTSLPFASESKYDIYNTQESSVAQFYVVISAFSTCIFFRLTFNFLL